MKRRKAHIFAKEKHGHYVEPGWCSERLFEVEDFGPPGSRIYDPACGWGTILQSAMDAGYRAIGTDKVNRMKRKRLRKHLRPNEVDGVQFDKVDFLYGYQNGGRPWFTPRNITSVVCNPPFDHVEEFCERALEIADYKVAMIMLLRRLPAARWLQAYPLETVYMLTPRPSMPPGAWIAAGNKPGGGTQDFCWLVFNKLRSRRQPPAMRWLFRWPPSKPVREVTSLEQAKKEFG